MRGRYMLLAASTVAFTESAGVFELSLHQYQRTNRRWKDNEPVKGRSSLVWHRDGWGNIIHVGMVHDDGWSERIKVDCLLFLFVG